MQFFVANQPETEDMQSFPIFLVYEQPIGLNVEFAAAMELAPESVITEPGWESIACTQPVQHVRKSL